jgi:hypothetical protein
MRVCRLLTTFAGVLLLGGSAGAAEWHVPADFATIQEAIDSPSVHAGDAIVVAPGSYAGATVTKAVDIRGTSPATIVDGPVVSAFGKAGFYFPGDGQGSGATITGFTFAGLPLPVFSRGADDVTVTQNTLSLFLQGVTNWGYGSWGNRWLIADNTLSDPGTSCGAGIGIMIGDFEGGTVAGNVIARNVISGRVRVPADDCGGYNAPGILLYADFRGAAGATIEGNIVTKNRVAIRAGTPRHGGDLVTFSGIELSDTRDDWANQPPAIESNVVNYNDLRGMEVPLSYNPDELASPTNQIENNYTSPGDYILNRRPGTRTLARPASSPIR